MRRLLATSHLSMVGVIGVLVTMLSLAPDAAIGQASYTWNVDADGNWNTASNWNPSGVPSGQNQTATLGTIITAARTVTMQTSQRVGFLNFNSDHAYLLTGAQVEFQRTANQIAQLTANGAGAHVLASNVLLRSNLEFSGSGQLTISGSIDNQGPARSLTKEGTGTLRLSGNNASWQGDITINQGTLIAAHNNALGNTSSALTVNSGGTLAFEGGVNINYNSMTAGGPGHAGSGALRNISGTNIFDSTINLSGATTVISNAGQLSLGSSTTWKQLNLGANTLTVGGDSNTTINLTISGTGGLVKEGGGDLVLAGPGGNTYSGNTLVREGTLILAKPNDWAHAVGGNLQIGDGLGPAVVRWETSNNINNNSIVTINDTGLMNLNGYNETVSGLVMTGGTITNSGTGILTLGNASTTVTVNASATPSTITSNLNLQASNSVFDVASGGSGQDLIINGAVGGAFGPHVGFTKTGDGVMVLAGSSANTFIGNVTVDGGILELAKTSGNAIEGASYNAITVNSGATLLLGNANQIGDTMPLVLAGGDFSTGATTGFDETLGTLTLSQDSSISLGTGVHLLNFANSSGLDWAWNGTLTIYGWSGDYKTGGDQGRIFFAGGFGGLTANQLSKISFDGFLHPGAALLSTGELVPVPEAEAVLAALLILGVIGFIERRRLAGWLRAARARPWWHSIGIGPRHS